MVTKKRKRDEQIGYLRGNSEEEGNWKQGRLDRRKGRQTEIKLEEIEQELEVANNEEPTGNLQSEIEVKLEQVEQISEASIQYWQPEIKSEIENWQSEIDVKLEEVEQISEASIEYWQPEIKSEMKLEREEASIVYWVANKEPDECIEYWKVIFV